MHKPDNIRNQSVNQKKIKYNRDEKINQNKNIKSDKLDLMYQMEIILDNLAMSLNESNLDLEQIIYYATESDISVKKIRRNLAIGRYTHAIDQLIALRQAIGLEQYIDPLIIQIEIVKKRIKSENDEND